MTRAKETSLFSRNSVIIMININNNNNDNKNNNKNSRTRENDLAHPLLSINNNKSDK